MRLSRAARLIALPLGLLVALVAGAGIGVGAQTYPPNTVVSSYSDARYCGDGRVSVVADASGSLLDICTTTGERIYPVAAGVGLYGAPTYNPSLPGGVPSFPPGYSPAAPGTAPYMPPASAPGAGTLPPFGNGYVPAASGASGITGTAIRQYFDGTSNCPNGDVTQTTTGFYCTANGQPAAATGMAPAYNPAVPGVAPSFQPPYSPGVGYLPGYGASGYGGTGAATGYNGTVIRQYNDGNSNCPGGDVTETTGGFYCTANGQPAARTA
jgi:hypothetical protein